MKEFLTTCYARAGKLPKGRLQVQTSRSAPQWWSADPKGLIWEFAPAKAIFDKAKANPLNPEWRREYLEQLEALHLDGRLAPILDRLPDGAVFLCWEGKVCECHRGILAEFLNAQGLAKVTEFIPDEACSKE